MCLLSRSALFQSVQSALPYCHLFIQEHHFCCDLVICSLAARFRNPPNVQQPSHRTKTELPLPCPIPKKPFQRSKGTVFALNPPACIRNRITCKPPFSCSTNNRMVIADASGYQVTKDKKCDRKSLATNRCLSLVLATGLCESVIFLDCVSEL